MSRLKHDYDFNLFETLTDTEFGKNYNISHYAASQLRSKYAPHTNTLSIKKLKEQENRKIRNENIDKLILEFIKNTLTNKNSDENFNQIVIINNFLIQYKLGHVGITQDRFQRIAKENNINIKFSATRIKNKPYSHGYFCIRSKCKCKIFKLSNNIRMFFYFKRLKLTMTNLDYLANEFLEIYNNDKSYHHKEFYDFIYGKYFELQTNSSDFLKESE